MGAKVGPSAANSTRNGDKARSTKAQEDENGGFHQWLGWAQLVVVVVGPFLISRLFQHQQAQQQAAESLSAGEGDTTASGGGARRTVEREQALRRTSSLSSARGTAASIASDDFATAATESVDSDATVIIIQPSSRLPSSRLPSSASMPALLLAGVEGEGGGLRSSYAGNGRRERGSAERPRSRSTHSRSSSPATADIPSTSSASPSHLRRRTPPRGHSRPHRLHGASSRSPMRGRPSVNENESYGRSRDGLPLHVAANATPLRRRPRSSSSSSNNNRRGYAQPSPAHSISSSPYASQGATAGRNPSAPVLLNEGSPMSLRGNALYERRLDAVEAQWRELLRRVEGMNDRALEQGTHDLVSSALLECRELRGEITRRLAAESGDATAVLPPAGRSSSAVHLACYEEVTSRLQGMLEKMEELQGVLYVDHAELDRLEPLTDLVRRLEQESDDVQRAASRHSPYLDALRRLKDVEVRVDRLKMECRGIEFELRLQSEERQKMLPSLHESVLIRLYEMSAEFYTLALERREVKGALQSGDRNPLDHGIVGTPRGLGTPYGLSTPRSRTPQHMLGTPGQGSGSTQSGSNRRIRRKNRVVHPEAKRDCIVCMEEFSDVRPRYQLMPCQHARICRDCSLTLWLTDDLAIRRRCPECQCTLAIRPQPFSPFL